MRGRPQLGRHRHLYRFGGALSLGAGPAPGPRPRSPRPRPPAPAAPPPKSARRRPKAAAPAAPDAKTEGKGRRRRVEAWTAEVVARGITATRVPKSCWMAAARAFRCCSRPACPTRSSPCPSPIASSSICPMWPFNCRRAPASKGAGLIAAYRYGHFAPGKSRMVIDATGTGAGGDGEPRRRRRQQDRSARARSCSNRCAIIPHARAAAPKGGGGRGATMPQLARAPQGRQQAADRDRRRARRRRPGGDQRRGGGKGCRALRRAPPADHSRRRRAATPST